MTTSIKRRYTISAHVAPGLVTPPEDTLTGGYMCGPHDAAKNYIGLYLPSYSLVSVRFVKFQDTEKHGLHSLWCAECIDHTAQLGAILYVRKL